MAGGAPPYYYDYNNVSSSLVQPSTVHIHNTGLARFFKRGLLQRAISVLDVRCPESWDKDYLMYSLFCWGSVAVFDSGKYGIIPQACTLYGYNVFYRPTEAIISNPLLGSIRRKIGKDCAVVKLRQDYCGILDIVDFYGDCLALCADTAQINVLNSKLSYIFAAKNKAAAEAFKKALDCVASGEPGVAVGQSLYSNSGEPLWADFAQNLKQNFIAPDVLNTMRVVYNMFDTEIGIPNSNQEKRERLISDEVNSNNVETYTRMDSWIDCLNEGCKEARRIFPEVNVRFTWRVKPAVEMKDAVTGDELEDGPESR